MSDYEETIKRTRDVVKKMALGMEFVVWGIENQQTTHYAMPLRTMLYDVLGYLKEYQGTVRQKKNTGIKEKVSIGVLLKIQRQKPQGKSTEE